MSPLEKQFLRELSYRRQCRMGLTVEGHAKAREEFAGLIDDGYVIERDLGFRPGFQLTDKGREYLAARGYRP